MEIEGTYTLQATPEDVWRSLMDRQVLLQAVPDIELLEWRDQDTFTLTIHIKQEPLIGTYRGRVSVTEQQYPYHYRLVIAGEGKRGSLHSESVVHLNKHDDNTIVAYKGSLDLGTFATLFPQSVVKGAVKLFIQRFFTALSDQLRTQQHISPDDDEAPQMALEGQAHNGNVVILSPVDEEDPVVTTFSHTLAHQLGLGAGDPLQEDRWARRIRRTGVISGLLLLVWIGTRLPGPRR